MSRLELAQLFQHADLTLAGLAVAAAGVQGGRLGPFALALQLLAQTEQQLGVAPGQVGVVAGEVAQRREHFGDRQARVEQVAAVLQVQVAVDVQASAEAARFGVERHALVAVDAQFGEHELGPVLGQVAEEQQAQAIAQRADGETVQAVQSRAPLAE